MEGFIEELKQSPSLRRTEEILSTVQNVYAESIYIPSTASLSFYSTVVRHTLTSIDPTPSLRQTLNDIFLCLPGLNGLVSRINALADSIDSEHFKPLTNRRIACSHINVLCHTLMLSLEQPKSLSKVCQRTKQEKIYFDQLNALFAGSRLQQCLSRALHVLEQYQFPTSEWNHLCNGDVFTRYIAEQLCGLDNVNIEFRADLLDKTVKLGHSRNLAQVLANENNIQLFLTLFRTMRGSSQWYCVETCVLPYFQQQYLQFELTDDTSERVSSIAAILVEFLKTIGPGPLFKHAESSSINFHMRRAIVLASFQLNNLGAAQLKELIIRWGSILGIKHNPLMIQEGQTQLLFLAISLVDEKVLKEVSFSTEYLSAISNRLAALSDRARLFGTLFAEELSSRAKDPKPLQFGLEGLYEGEQNLWRTTIAKVHDKPVSYSSMVWTTLGKNVPTPLNMASLEDALNQNSKLVSWGRGNTEDVPDRQVVELDSDDSDGDGDLKPYPFPEDDQEDSDDDPTLAKKERVVAPVYIKDLISYLGSDDYQKQYLALKHGADLIRRKAKFGQELEFYARPLTEHLAGARDTFDMEDFNAMRLYALSALVAACPSVVPGYLASLAFTADYSLQQRLCVLSSIALGARELSGQDVKKPGQKIPILPPEVHKLFATADVDGLAIELQRDLLEPTSERARNEIIGGPQVLRVSRKLARQREQAGTRITSNLYAKVASKDFFLPLIGHWYSNGGIRAIGSYSELLVAHFLKTLALLLHAAYPSSNDIPAMTGELFDLVLGQRANHAVPVLEGLLTIVLVCLDVNDGEFLVTRWPRPIVELKTWLEHGWQSIGDERVQGMAAGVLYRLTEITQKWQRKLMGEFASLEV
jgi:telomere length regulation protein